MTLGFSKMQDVTDTAVSYAHISYEGSNADLQAAPVFYTRKAERAVRTQSGLPLQMRGDAIDAVVQSRGRSLQLAIKRGLDIFGALLALTLLAPLTIVVAIAVKLTSPGPIFFSQMREGLNGVPFATYKFRSMRTDLCDITGVEQTKKDDPRVTPVGRFIRKTSIDELPQLFNVLRGDMSLVGPRPHVAGMRAGGTLYTQLVPYYDRRLEMAPGITGWAQANGLRGPTDEASAAKARVDHDIAYIQNYSLWLDVKILVKTIYDEFITGSGH